MVHHHDPQLRNSFQVQNSENGCFRIIQFFSHTHQRKGPLIQCLRLAKLLLNIYNKLGRVHTRTNGTQLHHTSHLVSLFSLFRISHSLFHQFCNVIIILRLTNIKNNNFIKKIIICISFCPWHMERESSSIVLSPAWKLQLILLWKALQEKTWIQFTSKHRTAYIWNIEFLARIQLDKKAVGK